MKYVLTFALVFAAFAANAEKIDRTLNAEADGRVNIEVIDGKITVQGWDKPEVRIVGSVSASKLEDFRFERKGSNIDIEDEGGHSFWNRRGSHGSTNLTVYAPKTSEIRVDGTSASFEFIGIEGAVHANTMSGDIELEGGVGTIDLESVSGDVDVNGARGRLNLASVSGDIRADGAANYFDAQTVSGSIRANIGMADRVELESVSGDIDIRLALSDDARLDADTVSGDIEIAFENNEINARFDIETGPGGDIRNNLSDDRQTSRNSFSGSLDFKIGSGDSSVNLETMSGTIKIEK